MKAIGKVLWKFIKVWTAVCVLVWAFIGLSEGAQLATTNEEYVKKNGYARTDAAIFNRACKRYKNWLMRT